MKANKRKAFTEPEKALLIQSYQASGKPKNIWCKENGIGLSTLHRWLQQAEHLIGAKPLQDWIPVSLPAATQANDLEVKVGRCSITITRQTDLNLLAGVLKVLSEVC